MFFCRKSQSCCWVFGGIYVCIVYICMFVPRRYVHVVVFLNIYAVAYVLLLYLLLLYFLSSYKAKQVVDLVLNFCAY